MTQFEFVQVTVAIILGLGLTDILRGLGEQFRKRSEFEVSWLQVGASCLLLMVTLGYLLNFWLNSEVTWTQPLFLLQAVTAISLALSAQFIKVDWSSDTTPETQYFDNSIATFSAWAMAPISAALFSLATDTQSVSDIYRIGIAILLVSLCSVKIRIYHQVVLTTLFLVAVAPILFATPIIGSLQLQ